MVGRVVLGHRALGVLVLVLASVSAGLSDAASPETRHRGRVRGLHGKELIVDPIYTNVSVIANGQGGVAVDQLSTYGEFGHALGRIGDVNGDGVTDFVVGAPTEETIGAVYVLLMTAQRTVDSALKITEGLRGFAGDLDTYDRFGYSADGVGDLDGNGVLDLAVGAPHDDDADEEAGAVYVLLMGDDVQVNATVKITTGQGGFNFTLDSYKLFGSGLAGAGDVDGNGVPDIAVGETGEDPGDVGAVYILMMLSNGSVSSATKITNAMGGLSASLVEFDFFGERVAALGDINGDGVPDIAVGAPFTDRAATSAVGSVYILHLAVNGTVLHDYEITSYTSGVRASLGSVQFASPSRVGDVDGDGIDDLVVGAWGGNSVFVLLLDADGLVRDFHEIKGIDTNGFGAGVSFVERGTGVSLLVSAPEADTYTGKLYVVDLPDRSPSWPYDPSASPAASPTPTPSITTPHTPTPSSSALSVGEPSATPSPTASLGGNGGDQDVLTWVGVGIAGAAAVCAGALAFWAWRGRTKRASTTRAVELSRTGGDKGAGAGESAAQTGPIPLPPGKQFHAFLSHDWGQEQRNHALVAKINDELKKRGVKTWFDNERMEGDIANQMASGIDASCVVIVFVTNQYMKKVQQSRPDNCKAEFNYAIKQRVLLIAVVTDEHARSMKDWHGPVGVHLCHLLYHDMCEPQPDDHKVDRLVQEIRSKCAEESA